MNTYESSRRGPGKGPRGSLPACFNLSGPPPLAGDSVGPLQHQHLFQVVAYPLQPKMIEVAHEAEKRHRSRP
jgi:hypothetical protein